MSFGSFWGNDPTDVAQYQKILPRYLPDEAIGASGTIRITPTTVLPLEIEPPIVANQTLTIINNDPTRGTVIVDKGSNYPVPSLLLPNDEFIAFGTVPIKIAPDNTGYLVYGRYQTLGTTPVVRTGKVYLYDPITDTFALLISTTALASSESGVGGIYCMCPLIPQTTGEAQDSGSYIMVGNFATTTIYNSATQAPIATVAGNQVIQINTAVGVPANFTLTTVGFVATDSFIRSPAWCIGRPATSTANFQFIVGGGLNNSAGANLTLTTATTVFYGCVVYNTNVGGGLASLVPLVVGDGTSGLYTGEEAFVPPVRADVGSACWTTDNRLFLGGNFKQGLIGATVYPSQYFTAITFGVGAVGATSFTPYPFIQDWNEYYIEEDGRTALIGLRYVKDPADGFITCGGNIVNSETEQRLPYMLIPDNLASAPVFLKHPPPFPAPNIGFNTILAVSDTQYMLTQYSSGGAVFFFPEGSMWGVDNATYAYGKVVGLKSSVAFGDWAYNANASPTAKPLTIYGFQNSAITPAGSAFEAICSEDFGINIDFVASAEQPVPAPLSYAIIENQYAEADGTTLGLVIHQTNATLTCIGDIVNNKWDLVSYTGDITFEP